MGHPGHPAERAVQWNCVGFISGRRWVLCSGRLGSIFDIESDGLRGSPAPPGTERRTTARGKRPDCARILTGARGPVTTQIPNKNAIFSVKHLLRMLQSLPQRRPPRMSTDAQIAANRAMLSSAPAPKRTPVKKPSPSTTFATALPALFTSCLGKTKKKFDTLNLG